MKQYKIGFSLGELLICLGLMAVIAAMIIPAASKHMPSKSKALFKKTYHNIEKITFDLINNTNVFPQATIESYHDNADLSTGFAYFDPDKDRERDDTGKFFCKRFTEELNTTGKVLCEEAHFMPAEEVAFMGDDLTDLPLLEKVGLAVTVPNAVAVVKEAAHFITSRNGGDGAYREMVDLIITAQGKMEPMLADIRASRWTRPEAGELQIVTSEEGIS